MPAREWAVPLLLGLSSGVLLAFAVPAPDRGDGPAGGAEGTDWSQSGFVFLEGPVVADPDAEPLLLHAGLPDGEAWHAARCGDFPTPPAAPGGGECFLRGGNPLILLVGGPGLFAAQAFPPAGCEGDGLACEEGAPFTARRAPADAPRFGADGHNATRLTVFAFNLDGEAVASNAPDAELARFRLAGGFFGLPDEAWYLGSNATAPPGTTRLPTPLRPLLEEIRPLLEGLPVGGIATVPYAHPLLGELWLTARVDALLPAP